MIRKEIWYHSFGNIERSRQSAVLEGLRRAHINPTAFASPSSTSSKGAGIVFFEEVSPALYEVMAEVSRHGLERVLALSLSDARLAETTIWKLLEAGACDVLTIAESAHLAEGMAARFARWQSIDEIVASPLVQDNLIGSSAAWIRALRQIVGVARFTDASMLITGESGTGKELIARLVHTLDERRNRRHLVVLDCTTIAPELSGSEFFGHERGAFTGAVAQRDGAFALADGGTLFLDEVGELPLPLQAELLRVVQEQSYKRVGSNNWQRADFRLICATNRNLLEQEARGEFRRDFYHRIASWTCHLPPLRERLEDILPLAEYFLRQQTAATNGAPPLLDEVVRDYLLRRAYPGNIRDLKQLVTRIACQHGGGGVITAGAIPEAERPTTTLTPTQWRDEAFEQNIRRALLMGLNLKEISRGAEEVAERLAIEDEDGNVARAARKLGVNERTLQMHRAARRERGASAALACP